MHILLWDPHGFVKNSLQESLKHRRQIQLTNLESASYKPGELYVIVADFSIVHSQDVWFLKEKMEQFKNPLLAVLFNEQTPSISSYLQILIPDLIFQHPVFFEDLIESLKKGLKEETRKKKRYKKRISVSVQHQGQWLSTATLDVSEESAKIFWHPLDRFKIGEDVLLKLYLSDRDVMEKSACIQRLDPVEKAFVVKFTLSNQESQVLRTALKNHYQDLISQKNK